VSANRHGGLPIRLQVAATVIKKLHKQGTQQAWSQSTGLRIKISTGSKPARVLCVALAVLHRDGPHPGAAPRICKEMLETNPMVNATVQYGYGV
jgi:hypothetical protein